MKRNRSKNAPSQKSDADATEENMIVDAHVEEYDEDDDDNDWTDNEDTVDEGEEKDPAIIINNKRTASAAVGTMSESPFLDSFYGLSAPLPRERARAAHTLLHHCLLNESTANAKDAAYALKRLLNGLCSGRVAARQGNASVLATFLRVVFAIEGRWAEIRSVYPSLTPSLSSLSDWEFVRGSLLSATESPLPLADSKSGGPPKTKGSEERDYQFGRLFGINAIVRSGILVAATKANGDEIRAVTLQLTQDLVTLYQSKKWLREPASHAICTLLSTLYGTNDDGTLSNGDNDDARSTAREAVDSVIIPNLLQSGDHERRANTGASVWASFSAEQIGLALFIQLHHQVSVSLLAPLDQVVLTKETIPQLASALSETSSVTQPRTHLVWDAFFLYISESVPSTNTTTKVVDIRTTRRSNHVMNEQCFVEDIVEAVLQHVVVERLLGIDASSDEKAENKGKTTHERRALALCLVRNLLGIEFVSSISGRTQIRLESNLIERVVLSPILVQRLFVDIICAGTTSSSKPQTVHLLKPLALHVLGQCVDSLCLSTLTLSDTWPTRLSVAFALLRSDARFDLRTKTNTVESLLGLDTGVDISSDLVESLWEPYLKFLMERILSVRASGEESTATTSLEAQGYIDLLFQFGKRLVRPEANSNSTVLTFKTSCLYRIYAFFLTTAFFDCGSCVLSDPVTTTPKKKNNATLHESIVLETAILVRDARVATTAVCPFNVRILASARFFSLVTEYVTTLSRSANSDKETRIQELLSALFDMQATVMKAGAKKLSASSTDVMETDEGEDPAMILKRLQKESMGVSIDVNRANKKWASGCAMLGSTLHLHLLSCGHSDIGHGHDDPDADDDEDLEEISELLSDLDHVSSLYSKGYSEDTDPLLALSEICASILSSPLGAGNQSRGASPTLLREIVKLAWIGGLAMSAEDPNAVLSSRVVNVLLNAIGTIDGEDDHDDDENDGEDENDSEEGSDGEGMFSSSKDVPEVRDKEYEGDGDNDREDDENEDQQDVELDPSKLQSMLEEDIDADIDEIELEHHEGADAALAKLIKLKQDARKAGQLARERSEIARQIRCVILLETLVVGKADSWGRLLSGETIVGMIVPILQYKKDLAKSLTKATSKGSSAGSTEKRAMLDKLTVLLRNRILKVKASDLKWTVGHSLDEKRELAATLVEQAKETHDKEHQSLCNSALILLFRSFEDVNAKLIAADLYSDIVEEWAAKRSRVDVSVLEGVIQYYPILAQACLGPALASAARHGQSPFLKSESFRLLSTLYNVKLNPNVSEFEKVALDRVVLATETVFASISDSLKDTEMRKTKRVREVLKTADKVLVFLNGTFRSPPGECVKHLTEINELLAKLKSESESDGICKSAAALFDAIDGILSSKTLTVKGVGDVECDENSGNGDKKTKASKTKKMKLKSNKNK